MAYDSAARRSAVMDSRRNAERRALYQEVEDSYAATGRGPALPAGTVHGPARRPVPRRPRLAAKRTHAVHLRFSDAEVEDVRLAAERADVSMAGYSAAVTVAVARGEVRPLPTATVQASYLVWDLCLRLSRIHHLLNQAVRRLNATGQPDPSLEVLAGRLRALERQLEPAVEHLRDTSRREQRRLSRRGLAVEPTGFRESVLVTDAVALDEDDEDDGLVLDADDGYDEWAVALGGGPADRSPLEDGSPA